MSELAKMPKYEKYKDSGVEWLGEIPDNWKAEKGKWLFTKVDRKPEKGDEVVTCFRDGEVTLRKNRRTVGFTNALKEHGYQRIQKGDLVIHAMDAFAGAIGVSDSDGKSTPVYSACLERYKNTVNPYFYAYFMRDLALSGMIVSLAKGIRERSTDFRFNDFAELFLAFPPLAEQTAIAEFLDDKTEKIDEAIAIKQKQIELLKERKQILIQNAVTRGLDPDVKLKDSGIDWIGQIPEHWDEGKVKHVTKIISKGTTPSTVGREILEDGPIRYLKAENISEGKITDKPLCFIDDKTNEIISRSQLIVDDLLFVIAGATLGKTAIVSKTVAPANTNQAVAFLRPNSKIKAEFLSFWLATDLINQLIWLDAVQSAQPNLSMEDLGNFPILLPPVKEQCSIVNFIKENNFKFDKAINLQQQQIEKLKEYKSTLINSAVTGKIKVV